MRKASKVGVFVIVALAITGLLVAGCSSGNTVSPSNSATGTGTQTATTSAGTPNKGPIRVGSKLDGEGVLLGQMILQVLQANGFKVDDKTRTGATQVVRQALVGNQIDVYPEYTANGPLVFHKNVKVEPSILQSAGLTYQTAKSEDASVGVTWLKQAPANNTWAVALPKKFAEANKITSMPELAAYIQKGGTFKIAGSQEFFTSDVAFPAFEKAYGFKVEPSQQVQVGTGDTSLPEKTAAQGTNGVNATMAYGTDGTISALDLVVLADPKAAQPIYQPAPTFRSQAIERYPEIANLLDPVFAKLDLQTLQTLNKQVAVDGKDAKTVAADWLKSNGFVK
jgi:osmoprotectant transport system substrate-binding protein